jgi:hypothetical protein
MTFTKFEDIVNNTEMDSLNEALNYELTEEDNLMFEKFEALYESNEISDQDVKDWLENPKNEGILGSIFGGLTGFALGKKIGKIIAKVMGIEKGILYDLLTSRIFGAAMGSTIGKQF